MKTSPTSKRVSTMAVCGPGLLGGSSEAITIGMILLVKQFELLALISLLTWLVGALFTCLMTDVLNLIDVVSVALELNNQAANERTIECLEEVLRDF